MCHFLGEKESFLVAYITNPTETSLSFELPTTVHYIILGHFFLILYKK